MHRREDNKSKPRSVSKQSHAKGRVSHKVHRPLRCHMIAYGRAALRSTIQAAVAMPPTFLLARGDFLLPGARSHAQSCESCHEISNHVKKKCFSFFQFHPQLYRAGLPQADASPADRLSKNHNRSRSTSQTQNQTHTHTHKHFSFSLRITGLGAQHRRSLISTKAGWFAHVECMYVILS